MVFRATCDNVFSKSDKIPKSQFSKESFFGKSKIFPHGIEILKDFYPNGQNFAASFLNFF